MSAPCDTDEGTGESHQFDEWLKLHKLQKAKDKLDEHQVTFDELKVLGNAYTINQLRLYGTNTLGIDIIQANRFAQAVAELSSNIETNNDTKAKPNVVRVLILQEEKDSLNNIDKRREEIKSQINASENNVKSLTETTTLNCEKLNQFRKDVIYQINERIDELIHHSNQIINKKKEMIGVHIKELQNVDKQLKDATIECDQLLDDIKMDINQRRNKIIDICNNVVEIKVKNIIVTPEVTLQVNTNSIVDFINTIGCINDDDIPIISVAEVESSSATLTVNNNSNSYDCLAQISKNVDTNTDDEKKEIDEWKHLCWMKNTNEYKITSMDTNIRYRIRARYQYKSYGTWCEPILFKTKLGSETSDGFDINNSDIFHYIAKKHGQAYHVFGQQLIKRACTNEYKWVIEVGEYYSGRIGIIDDTNNASKQLKNGSSILGHQDVAIVGSSRSAYHGSLFGKTCSDLISFIQRSSDTITISLNYKKNTILFESRKSDTSILKKLRNGIKCVRLIADIYDKDSTVQIIYIKH